MTKGASFPSNLDRVFSHAYHAGIRMHFKLANAYFASNEAKEIEMKFREKITPIVQNHRAMRELADLDDRALAELGVSRSSIRASVKGTL
jgi:uncharacterized protein YjiS (DUF1127 family)